MKFEVGEGGRSFGARALTRDAPSGAVGAPRRSDRRRRAIRAVLDRGQPRERETSRGRGRGAARREPHPSPRPPGECTARVLEILSQRARRCSRSRSSLRGLTQRSRPVSSSSLSSSSSSSSSLRPSPPRNTLSSGRVTLPRSGVGGGTSYVDLRLTGTPRTSLACVAGSLARVDRGRHRQLPMRAGFGGERYEL